MADTETNVEALTGEFKQLRAEFSRIAQLLEQTARSAGAEAALLLASHRLSLFRMSALLMAARRDIQKGVDAKTAQPAMVDLP